MSVIAWRARTRERSVEHVRDARAHAAELVLGGLRQTPARFDADTLCLALHVPWCKVREPVLGVNTRCCWCVY